MGALVAWSSSGETTPEVFLDTTERPKTKLEEMVFVGKLDRRALWFLLGVVFDLG